MMFEPSDTPRVIGVPPGADFLATLFERLTAVYDPGPPEALARVLIVVPNNRMQRRLTDMFRESPVPRLLPRIHVVTDIAPLVPGAALPARVSTLRRSLELKALVARLVELDPRLAASSVVALSESLAAVLDEMQGEGVSFDAIDAIDADASSGHWQRSLTFLRTIRAYTEALTDGTADSAQANRLAAEALCARWRETPPETPVLVAGSTGSRATTRMLMEAVCRLPQGAVILPGFDRKLPEAIWSSLPESRQTEDHPQYRLAAFLDTLGLGRDDVITWGDPPHEERNTLISLSLRPPSVTDQWRTEGPELEDLDVITNDLTLIEAQESRDESLAIAAAIRHGIETGRRVALIAPDATLARRVAAALDRWSIWPDDSGAAPLSLTPEGRFLRLVAALIGKPTDPIDLFALLKHPFNMGDKLVTQRFELFVRRRQALEITPALLEAFAEDRADGREWICWLKPLLERARTLPDATLAGALDRHLELARGFAGAETFFEGDTGEILSAVFEKFAAETDFPGPLAFADYLRFLDGALDGESDRPSETVRSDVMIWGNIESRAQGADLVILGGMNEGTWPRDPAPDPWLNRRMRHQTGLFLPERRIGLAAHDYQQAMGAPEVILTRARRSDGTETVPSRWLNRLTNLLRGLSGGEAAIQAMARRGAVYLATAERLDAPVTPVEAEKRPAPAPPVHLRPRDISVTRIQTLIRDPYAIYADRILRLKPLDPLRPEPDARARGIAIHKILEHVLSANVDLTDFSGFADHLGATSRTLLDRHAPWPAPRAEWLAGLMRNAEWLFETEKARLADADPSGREAKGSYTLPGTDIRVTGKADRIDRLASGELAIYDYKTGSVPGAGDVKRYDRQLPVLAVMAEAGGFPDIPQAQVARLAHIALGRTPDEKALTFEPGETVTVSGELARLLTGYLDPEVGYLSRRAMEKQRFDGDYDHLARFGEWSDADDAIVEKLP